MSEHSERYPRWAAAVPVCRNALQIGYLTRSGNHWKFGQRKFHGATVNKLIDNGEAVRVGDHVVAWRPAA
jgi:hypothetical protein